MIKTYRRELHMIPEVSTKEEKTRAYLKKKLECLDVELKMTENGGIIVYKAGTVGHHTIAFRADMDGLQTCEQTGLEFASRHDGVMHACGHDGHMAMLLALTEHISSGSIKSNVVLIFQPAEEFIGGADTIVKSGVLDSYGIEAIFAFHIMPTVPEGKIGIKPGPQMAHATEIDVEITGEAAHCAHPDKGTDALYAAAHLLCQYHGVVSRNVSPLKTAVVNIGTVTGGSARNIVCDSARLYGTMRTFDDQVCETVKNRLIAIGEGVEKGFGCKVNTVLRDFYPAVINDQGLYQMVKGLLPEDDVVETEPLMTAEDFSYYAKVAPTMFMILGSGSEVHNYPLHNPKFDFNEDILYKGVEAYKKIIDYYDSL